MKPTKRKQKQFTHWNEQLNLQYHFFLILNYQDFISRSKKSNKLYKEMSRFLKAKTSTQCRTHHQKKIKGLPREVDILYHFYHDYYKVRYLQNSHLITQIKRLLQIKIKQQIILPEQAKNLEDELQDSLRQLDFEKFWFEKGNLVRMSEKVETKNQGVQFSQQKMFNQDISHFLQLDCQIYESNSSDALNDQKSQISSRFQ